MGMVVISRVIVFMAHAMPMPRVSIKAVLVMLDINHLCVFNSSIRVVRISNLSIDGKQKLLFFFIVGTNSPCNNVTQDCATNPNNGSAMCTCKLGYELNNTNNICQGRRNENI